MVRSFEWNPAIRYSGDSPDESREHEARLSVVGREDRPAGQVITVTLQKGDDGIWHLTCKELHIERVSTKQPTLAGAKVEAELQVLDDLADKIMLYRAVLEKHRK